MNRQSLPNARSRTSLRRKSNKIIRKSQQILVNARPILDQAQAIASRFNLDVNSSILDESYKSNFLPSSIKPGNNFLQPANQGNYPSKTNAPDPNSEKKSSLLLYSAAPTILRTTGGYSNTDHLIQCTGDPTFDKIAEYKRSLQRRAKSLQPEQRGIDRWDQPRIAGVRRRRIVREKDLPKAPPEPPHSGYVIFITQMTAKVRHDRPNDHHNQTNVVQKISKMWKYGLTAKDRAYYNDFAREAKEEYESQHTEYRATGTYTSSTEFERIHGNGPWVRSVYNKKNALEKEIATYDRVTFAPRPENVEVPFWVKKGQGERERGAHMRKIAEEKKRKREQEQWEKLEAAKRLKARRLAMIEIDKKKREIEMSNDN